MPIRPSFAPDPGLSMPVAYTAGLGQFQKEQARFRQEKLEANRRYQLALAQMGQQAYENEANRRFDAQKMIYGAGVDQMQAAQDFERRKQLAALEQQNVLERAAQSHDFQRDQMSYQAELQRQEQQRQRRDAAEQFLFSSEQGLNDIGQRERERVLNDWQAFDSEFQAGKIRPAEYDSTINELVGRTEALRSPRYKAPPPVTMEQFVDENSYVDPATGGKWIRESNKDGTSSLKYVSPPKKDPTNVPPPSWYDPNRGVATIGGKEVPGTINPKTGEFTPAVKDDSTNRTKILQQRAADRNRHMAKLYDIAAKSLEMKDDPTDPAVRNPQQWMQDWVKQGMALYDSDMQQQYQTEDSFLPPAQQSQMPLEPQLPMPTPGASPHGMPEAPGMPSPQVTDSRPIPFVAPEMAQPATEYIPMPPAPQDEQQAVQMATQADAKRTAYETRLPPNPRDFEALERQYDAAGKDFDIKLRLPPIASMDDFTSVRQYLQAIRSIYSQRPLPRSLDAVHQQLTEMLAEFAKQQFGS